jgi:hypothetical protein
VAELLWVLSFSSPDSCQPTTFPLTRINELALAGRESVILERNWAGRGYVVQGKYTCFGDSSSVLSFAVDEQHGLLLTSTVGEQVFTARTLDGAHIVWQMPMACILPSLNSNLANSLSRFCSDLSVSTL